MGNVETSKRRNAVRAGGWTVAELLVVVMIVAILAGLALAPAGANDSSQAESAGRMYSGMIQYAQSLAIARPDKTYIIKIDQACGKLWLADASAPTTALSHPITKQPYQIIVGANSPIGLTALSIAAYDFGGDDTLGFDSTGGVDQTTAPTINFAAGGAQFEIAMSLTTGAVTVRSVQATSGGAIAIAEF